MSTKKWICLTYLTLILIYAFVPQSYAESTEEVFFSVQPSVEKTAKKLPRLIKDKLKPIPPIAPSAHLNQNNTPQKQLRRAGCTYDDHGNSFDNATITSPNSTVSGTLDCNTDYVDYPDYDMFKVTLQNAGTLKLTFPANIGVYFYKTATYGSEEWFNTENSTFNLSAGTYYFAFTTTFTPPVNYQVTFECQGCDGTVTTTNHAPTISQLTAPSSIKVNEQFTLSATCIDQDNNESMFSCYADSDFYSNGLSNNFITSEFKSSGSTLTIPNLSFDSAGNKQISCQCYDSKNEPSNNANVSINVNSEAITIYPSEPQITAPTSAKVGEKISVSIKIGENSSQDKVKVKCRAQLSNYTADKDYISGKYYDSGFQQGGTTVVLSDLIFNNIGHPLIFCRSINESGLSSGESSAMVTVTADATTNTAIYTDYFHLKLSQPLTVNASVHYKTRDGSAIAGVDYIAKEGTAIIPAGQTSVDIGIDILKAGTGKTFSLVITNPVGAKFPAGKTEIIVSHTIKQNNGNQNPIANAGMNKTLMVGTLDSIIGLGTDSDGTIINYEWKEKTGTASTPEYIVISASAVISLSNFSIGTHTLILTVTDDKGATGSDTVIITINEETTGNNKAPTANAGADKTITVGENSSITGSGTDSDGSIVSYQWKEGNALLSSNASLSLSSFSVGTHVLTLTVTDDDGAVASDSVVVIIERGLSVPTKS